MHDQLTFGKDWDHARTELAAKVADLSAAASTVADTVTDVDGIRRNALRYAQLAETVASSVSDLRRAITESADHSSEAMDALAAQADAVVPKLSQIQDRYETAGSALSTFADALEEAQRDVRDALGVRDADGPVLTRLDLQIRDAQADLQWTPATAPDSGRAEIDRLERLAEPLVSSLSDARARYDAARHRLDAAGTSAQRAIERSVDADGLNDSAWDRFKSWVTDNMGWLKTLKDGLSIAATVVGVVSIFFPVLLPLAVVLAGATLLMSVTFAATGNGSWLDVGLDTVALLTLGVGAGLGAGVKVTQRALQVTRSARLAWSGSKGVGLVAAAARPARALAAYGEESVRVADDLAQALPGGFRQLGRPEYRSLQDLWQVFRNGGTDGAAFEAIARNAKLGAGGRVDDMILRAGRSLNDLAFVNNIVSVADIAVSWHDDLINGDILNIPFGLRDLPHADGLFGRYGDWWSEVDGSTVQVIGDFDPAGRS